MSNEIKGKLKSVLPIESGTSAQGKAWKKQIFIITVPDGQYENDIAFEVSQDKVMDFLKGFRVGTELLVKYNIRSREWQNKWFTSATAWSVSSITTSGNAAPQAAAEGQIPDSQPLPF